MIIRRMCSMGRQRGDVVVRQWKVMGVMVHLLDGATKENIRRVGLFLVIFTGYLILNLLPFRMTVAKPDSKSTHSSFVPQKPICIFSTSSRDDYDSDASEDGLQSCKQRRCKRKAETQPASEPTKTIVTRRGGERLPPAKRKRI